MSLFSNNNSRIKSEICSKLTKEDPDVVLVSLFLTLNIFDTLSFCYFEQVNAGRNTLLR